MAMHHLEELFLRTIKEHKLFDEAHTIVAAVSAGPDSVALLHLLCSQFPDQVTAAVYVNHQLRPDETPAEEALVKETCRRYGISFSSVPVNIKDEIHLSGESLEEGARRLRYGALEQERLRYSADLIALGHTRDDQVENFFIRLVRGSGLQGLTGIPIKQGSLVRPLLAASKEEILSYLEQNALPYALDSSNFSRQIVRNRVRLDLLPLLENEFNPSIRTTVLSTTSILQEDENYLAEETERMFQSLVRPADAGKRVSVPPELTIPRHSFNELHPAIARRVAEKACWDIGSKPSFKAIEQIRRLAQRGKTGTECHLPHGGRAIITADDIVFLKRQQNHPGRGHDRVAFEEQIVIEGDGCYSVPSLHAAITVETLFDKPKESAHCLLGDAEKISLPLVLRAPFPQEKMRPAGAPGRKKITRLLTDKKIPRHHRHRYPVIVSGNDIIAVAGLVICHEVRIQPGTKRYLKISFAQNVGTRR